MARMRVDLYKLQLPPGFNLATRVNHIYRDSLEDRNRDHEDDKMRLEKAKKEGHLWYLDFYRIRMKSGPAKSGLTTPSTGFSLRPDQGFGEGTAMLWDTVTNWCVMQYNHHSLRPNTIGEYLVDYINPNDGVIHFLPKFDPQLIAKLRQKTIVKKILLEVAPGFLGNEDYDEGVSLIKAAKNLQRDHSADTVTLELTAEHGEGRGIGIDLVALTTWIHGLYAKGNHDAVPKAGAAVKHFANERQEWLDLLGDRITAEVEVRAGADRVVPANERWEKLNHFYTVWEEYRHP